MGLVIIMHVQIQFCGNNFVHPDTRCIWKVGGKKSVLFKTPLSVLNLKSSEVLSSRTVNILPFYPMFIRLCNVITWFLSVNAIFCTILVLDHCWSNFFQTIESVTELLLNRENGHRLTRIHRSPRGPGTLWWLSQYSVFERKLNREFSERERHRLKPVFTFV